MNETVQGLKHELEGETHKLVWEQTSVAMTLSWLRVRNLLYLCRVDLLL